MVIRVSQVVGRMMGGGVEANVMNYYRHIDKSRIQFDFIVQNDSTVVPEQEIKELGGRIFYIPSYKNIIAYTNSLYHIFNSIHPLIVHSNMNAISVFTLKAAKRAEVPIRIAHSHSTGNPNETVKNVVKNMLKPYSKIYPTELVACSEYSGKWLFGEDAVQQGKVKIIKNAIESDRFTFSASLRNNTRKMLGIPAETVAIGVVGRFCAQKNQAFALHVFADILKKNPNAHLYFAGDGDSRQEIEGKVSSMKLNASVDFLGNRSDINLLYQAFDVLLMPSLYEGLPVAGIEAQAASLPIIASDKITNEASIVSNGMTFISLDAPSEVWADAVLQAAHQSRKPGAERHREIIEAGYDISQNADEVSSWYENLVERL